MGRSIYTRHLAAFESNLVGRGIVQRYDIREERRKLEAEAKAATEARHRAEAKYKREHGCTRWDTTKKERDAALEALVGELPTNLPDGLSLTEQAAIGKAAIENHGESDGLPDTNSEYFSFAVREELIWMLGARSSRQGGAEYSIFNRIESFRVMDGQWEFSMVLEIDHRVKGHISKELNHVRFGFGCLDTEVLSSHVVRIWFPLGVISDRATYSISSGKARQSVFGWSSETMYDAVNHDFSYRKFSTPSASVVEMYNAHHLYAEDSKRNFVHLTNAKRSQTKQQRSEKEAGSKQAKLNKLWK